MGPEQPIFPLTLEEKALRRAGRDLKAAGLPTRLRNLMISAGYRSPEEIQPPQSPRCSRCPGSDKREDGVADLAEIPTGGPALS